MDSQHDMEQDTVKAAWDAKERLKSEGFTGGHVVALSPKKMHAALSLIYAKAAQGEHRSYLVFGRQQDQKGCIVLDGDQLKIEIEDSKPHLRASIVGFKNKTDYQDFAQKVDSLSKTIDEIALGQP